MTWKRIGTKKILDHPRFKVHEDIVELPNGKQTDYIWVERPQAAQVIAINSDGKILLQKEYSYPPDEHLLQFPGGALDKGENPEEGAARELAEESGLAGDLKQIGWFYPDNRRNKSQFYVFVATNLKQADGVKDVEEEFEDFWFTLEEMNSLIRKGEITNYSALAAWALFINRR